MVRLRSPRGEKLAGAEVYVNGKRVKVIKGKRLTAPVDLRGLPKGRFKVEIRITTISGKRFTATRRYRTCTPSRARAADRRVSAATIAGPPGAHLNA